MHLLLPRVWSSAFHEILFLMMLTFISEQWKLNYADRTFLVQQDFSMKTWRIFLQIDLFEPSSFFRSSPCNKNLSSKFEINLTWKFLSGFQNLEVSWIRGSFFSLVIKIFFEVAAFKTIGWIKIWRISSKKFFFASAEIFEDELEPERADQITFRNFFRSQRLIELCLKFKESIIKRNF